MVNHLLTLIFVGLSPDLQRRSDNMAWFLAQSGAQEMLVSIRLSIRAWFVLSSQYPSFGIRFFMMTSG